MIFQSRYWLEHIKTVGEHVSWGGTGRYNFTKAGFPSTLVLTGLEALTCSFAGQLHSAPQGWGPTVGTPSTLLWSWAAANATLSQTQGSHSKGWLFLHNGEPWRLLIKTFCSSRIHSNTGDIIERNNETFEKSWKPKAAAESKLSILQSAPSLGTNRHLYTASTHEV